MLAWAITTSARPASASRYLSWKMPESPDPRRSEGLPVRTLGVLLRDRLVRVHQIVHLRDELRQRP
jgi:hypothetical protein